MSRSKFAAQPDEWLNRVVKAEVQRLDGKSEDAIKSYLDAIKRVGEDKRLTKEGGLARWHVQFTDLITS